jgi:hypothetical protein
MRWFRRSRKVDGHAVVLERNNAPLNGEIGSCAMTLRLEVPGVPPQDVHHREWAVQPNRWPEVGMRVAVTVDPDAPGDVDAHWDSVFGARHGGGAGLAAELAGMAVGIDLDLSKGTGEDPLAVTNEEVEATVAHLNARFAAGEITAEQMNQSLRDLLGSDPSA